MVRDFMSQRANRVADIESRDKASSTMIMMIGETRRSNPTIQVPPWDLVGDPTVDMASPFPIFSDTSVNYRGNATGSDGENLNGHGSSPFDAVKALHRYLPSNTIVINSTGDSDFQSDDSDIPADGFSCDQFRMFEFKVRKCGRGRSHDWTECPFAHPGEKARRRDPRKFHYSGTPCPEFRKGQCKKGDSCEFSHGVFECWLHPARYRTQPCKDGTHCRRRVCFFAHTPDQLRVLPQSSPRMIDSYEGSPSRLGFDSFLSKGSIGSPPASTLYSPPISPASESPPTSPNGSLGVNSVSELASSMRNLHIGKVRMSMSPSTVGPQMGSAHCSPRSPSNFRPSFQSLPSTPTTLPRSGLGVFDQRDSTFGEEPLMERVDSGRDLRAKIYEKLSRDNSVGRVDSLSPGPDLGWVSELVK